MERYALRQCPNPEIESPMYAAEDHYCKYVVRSIMLATVSHGRHKSEVIETCAKDVPVLSAVASELT
jgi:hypothetical protein